MDKKNMNHKDFKEPFPSYEKGENSKSKPNNKVNYTYSNEDNIINTVEPIDVEYYDVITIKGKQDNAKPKKHFFLRDPSLKKSDGESSETYANAVTCSCAKLVLKGPVPSSSFAKIEQHKDKAFVGPSRKCLKPTMNVASASYSIIDQMQRKNAHIIIFELLKILPAHR